MRHHINFDQIQYLSVLFGYGLIITILKEVISFRLGKEKMNEVVFAH